MRILVVGAGATGGYFGGRLAQAGRDVTFLVRSARAEQIRRAGLCIVSPHGDVTLEPPLLVAGQAAAPFDAVVLTVKAFALEQALVDLAPFVGAATMVLPLLNGMRHLDLLQARFGAEAVLGGVCLVATTLDGEGRVVQLADMQQLIYGELGGAMSGRIAALDGQLQNAGFAGRASAMILQEMWEKWVMLATMGGVTCLMRGTIGQIEAVPDGADFARQFLAESAAVAAASGFAPRADYMARTTAMMTARGSGAASSMYRDLQQNSRVEVEHILADLLDRAKRLGVATPLLTLAVAHLRVYQNRVTAA